MSLNSRKNVALRSFIRGFTCGPRNSGSGYGTGGVLVRASHAKFRCLGDRELDSSFYRSAFGQRRHFDLFPTLAVPSTLFYLWFLSWRPKRDLFSATCGTVINTTKFGKVQYKITYPETKLGDPNPDKKENAEEIDLPSHKDPVDQDIILFFHGTPAACDQFTGISSVTTFQLPFPVISISRPGCLGTDIPKSTIAYMITIL